MIPIPFHKPSIGKEEEEAIIKVLRSGYLTSGVDPSIKDSRRREFEEVFAAYVGSKYAVSLNSCGSALFLSLKAYGIGEGDEVITTPMTYAATVNAIEATGAETIFVDIDPYTLNIDHKLIEKK